jgi:Family of unknown function (DUF6065)
MIDLTCFVNEGWIPRIRPAPYERDWMESSPERYAHRCLPLNIANMHGWEILCPCDFSTMWTGGLAASDVHIRIDTNAHDGSCPVSLFGLGTITFHIQGLFKTSPGWNLWVGGSPNWFKDGIQPLTGIVETDWAPYTYTMNWKLTRPNMWVDWKEHDPMCFIFPLQRDAITTVIPRIKPLSADPDFHQQFTSWSKSRDEFHANVNLHPPAQSKDQWQKHYYQGKDMKGQIQPDHKTKIRLPDFIR